MSTGNIFDSVNQQIFDFVHERANRSLIPGTGSYSTPFRGRLFGLSKSLDVAKKLDTRGVDVLWLGANPCVPESLENIVNPQRSEGHFPDFVRQVASGLFSSRRWDDQGHPSTGWNPIDQPRGGWIVYRDILEAIGFRRDRMTMANFVPWGSQDTKAFVSKLGGANPKLLKRALVFADELNSEIVNAIKPKLLLVPLSFGRERAIDNVYLTGVAMKATDPRPHKIEIDQTPSFNFYTGKCSRRSFSVSTVYVPHPSSLRLNIDAKSRVMDGVCEALKILRQ